ncbi:MAG TPA: hypothetical protein VFV31_08105 [Chitinophagaceae bacterium]|nr:hypothetical protein [Chitinophagaceae bacterium]
MNHPANIAYGKILRRKLAVISLIAFSAFAAFATLGDGKKANSLPVKSNLLSGRTTNTGSFSLRSGYNFRGSQVLTTTSEKRYINLNTTLTVHKGNTTYIVPLKKKVVANVKIDLGNRSLQRR